MGHTISASVGDYFAGMTEMLQTLDYEAVEEYAEVLYSAWQENRCVFLFGNGGSAFTAGHHALDYAKTASVDNQRRLKAISLVDNIGVTTAIGNDISFDETFVYPLEVHARPGDVAVAISCSGNSPNAVRGCRWAKEHEMTVVALTGFDGGVIGRLADLHINIPSDNYGIVEDLQMTIGHVAAQLLRHRVQQLAGGELSTLKQ